MRNLPERRSAAFRTTFGSGDDVTLAYGASTPPIAVLNRAIPSSTRPTRSTAVCPHSSDHRSTSK